MDIREKFLELTSRTYPHGTEKEVFPLLCNGLQEDEFGNLFIKIGESDVMFTAHLDTATGVNTSVNHVFEGNLIKTDGKSILGADDKSGVTIMLYMIEQNVPGLYYFFLGEEVGCIGSKKTAASQKENKIESIKKVISFDRKGTGSVITYQSGARCCSDKFGQALSNALNLADETFKYECDDTGVLTDSIQFVSIYPECTNISVGYRFEHTHSEQQDIEHLEKLAKACVKVDWNSLPVERDPSTTEYKSYGSYCGGYWEDDYAYGYGRGYNSLSSWGKPVEKTENVWFYDNKYRYLSKVEIVSGTKKVKSVDLCRERKEYERMLIEDLLVSLEIEFLTTEWDGINLTAYYKNGGHKTECTRNELIEFLPELDYSEGGDLGEYSNDYVRFSNDNRSNYADNYGYCDDIWD
jgi:putative aminopeptidase FrvX